MLKILESPLDCKEIQLVHPKGNQSWIFIGRYDAEAETPVLWIPEYKELTHLKRLWCWERLMAEGEGDDRGWDVWMASLIQLTWVWVDSRSWWSTGRPGVLRFMGFKESDMTEQLNWLNYSWVSILATVCTHKKNFMIDFFPQLKCKKYQTRVILLCNFCFIWHLPQK